MVTPLSMRHMPFRRRGVESGWTTIHFDVPLLRGPRRAVCSLGDAVPQWTHHDD